MLPGTSCGLTRPQGCHLWWHNAAHACFPSNQTADSCYHASQMSLLQGLCMVGLLPHLPTGISAIVAITAHLLQPSLSHYEPWMQRSIIPIWPSSHSMSEVGFPSVDSISHMPSWTKRVILAWKNICITLISPDRSKSFRPNWLNDEGKFDFVSLNDQVA